MAIAFPDPTVEQYFRTFRIGMFAVDDAEQRVIFSANIDGKVNLWALDLEQGYPYPLTTLGEDCGAILPDPKGRYLIAAFDKDGDENWQVYALPPAGGRLVALLEAEGEKFFPIDVSKDGRFLYYTTSRGNATFLNSYRLNLETREQQLLHEGAGAPTFIAKVAPSGDVFVTAESYSNTIRFLYLHKDGRRIPLRTGDEPHAGGSPVFLDDDTVFFLTDEGDDVHYLARFDAEDGRVRPVAKVDGHDLHWLQLHREGKALYMVGMRGVVDRLYRYDIEKDELDRDPAAVRHRRPVPCRQERCAVRARAQRQRAVQHQHEASRWRRGGL